MSRTDIPPAILAWSLRRMAGDGSVEWVTQPIRASELLDVADALDENARLISVLHEVEAEAVDAYICLQHDCELLTAELENRFRKHWHEQCENAKLRELVRAAWKCIHTGASCSDCRLIAGGCTLQTAMRELGVEVDDG